jgi:hypothetical protein
MAALRVKWCRCRARAMRYAEEVELLLEEMRRVLAFLEWDRDRWNKRALHSRQADTATHSPLATPRGTTAAFEEGLRAYALRQASIRQRLFDTFAQQWHDVPKFIRLIDREFADEEVESTI